MDKLSHIDNKGEASMVDISNKETSYRIAKATARVKMSPTAYELLISANNKKGDVLTIAKIAGINAAKQCGYLIPLCHPLPLSKAKVEMELNKDDSCVVIYTEVSSMGKTGVEMEALTSASVAALTIYDMLKAVDKGIKITDISLLEKHGGKSGSYYASNNP